MNELVALTWHDTHTGASGACEGSPMPRHEAEALVGLLIRIGAWDAGYAYRIDPAPDFGPFTVTATGA